LSHQGKTREQLVLELDELHQLVSELQAFHGEDESLTANLLRSLGESFKRRTSVLNSLVDAIAECVILTDRDGKVLALNEAAAESNPLSDQVRGVAIWVRAWKGACPSLRRGAVSTGSFGWAPAAWSRV
jgi:PAS domain-containing protein